MRYFAILALTISTASACGGGGQPAQTPDQEMEGASSEQAPETAQQTQDSDATDEPNDAEASQDGEASAEESAGDGKHQFQVHHAKDKPSDAHGVKASKIKPSKTEAAMKFVVVDKDKGPIEGIVISLTAPDGTKYFTEETDAKGYAEVLVPVGKKYDLVYLSLGRKDITASLPVSDEPNQTIRLTLRYKRFEYEGEGKDNKFILSGVTFDTGKAKIRPDSFHRLDSVVEYMAHKRGVKIEISGHTDNVGDPKKNKLLSEKRAQACKDYLVSKGIDASRIQAVGYGAEHPIASNDTAEGRQQNRRIEAKEL